MHYRAKENKCRNLPLPGYRWDKKKLPVETPDREWKEPDIFLGREAGLPLEIWKNRLNLASHDCAHPALPNVSFVTLLSFFTSLLSFFPPSLLFSSAFIAGSHFPSAAEIGTDEAFCRLTVKDSPLEKDVLVGILDAMLQAAALAGSRDITFDKNSLMDFSKIPLLLFLQIYLPIRLCLTSESGLPSL